MHTKTATKVILALMVLVVLGGLYVHHVKKVTDQESAAVSAQPSASPYTTQVSGFTLTLYKNGTSIQTLALGEDATADMNLLNGTSLGVEPFITGQDVNFDGYPDVAMLTGLGYGGVNAFYDYYVFDPFTEKLVADPVLAQICNPVFDPAAKTVTGDAKDAQDSYKTVYTWNGTAYEKGSTVSDSTGQIEDDTD